jgi:5'-nucleotidase
LPRVLLTNDDGVDRPGIRAFRASLIDAGLDVTTIAPAANESGVSGAVTVHRDVELRPLEHGRHPVYACTGTPVDCVRIGLLSDVAPDVALVVSGINHGTNLGDDTAYSGTVGAAIEAAHLRRCGIAFSQQSDDHQVGLLERGGHSFPLAPVAAAIARRAAERPGRDGSILNVNLPSRLDTATPMQVARLGRRSYPPGWLAPYEEHGAGGVLRFQPYAGLSEESPWHETDADVDFTAVLAGRIAVTPMSLLDGRSGAPAVEWLAALDLPPVVADAVVALDSAFVVHPGRGR